LLPGDVHDKGLEMPLVQPQAGGERVQFCLAGRADGQLAALGCKSAGQCLANAAGRAGDQDNTVFQMQIHSRKPPSVTVLACGHHQYSTKISLEQAKILYQKPVFMRWFPAQSWTCADSLSKQSRYTCQNCWFSSTLSHAPRLVIIHCSIVFFMVVSPFAFLEVYGFSGP